MKVESSCKQSVIKSSNLYRRHVPTPSAEGTDGKRLEEVSQEKSVRSDTSVLTLIQSSAGNSRGSFGGGAGGRLAGSGGFGGGGSEGIGRLAA